MPPSRISNPSSLMTNQNGQNHTSAMLCEPSEDKSMSINTQQLSFNATGKQQLPIGPLPSANSTANKVTEAQLVQAIQQQQQQQQQRQQLEMQLQLQLQQAAAAAAQPFSAQQTQQQQLMAHLIANSATCAPTSNANATAIQTALLLQQQQRQRQHLELLARSQVQQNPLLPHNLIPKHLQASSLAASLDGTPGYQPALILPSSSLTAMPNPTSITNPTTLKLIGPNSTTTTTTANNNNNNTTTAATLQQQLTANLPSPFPVLTVQDEILRGMSKLPPIYNGVNLQYPGLRQLHANPPVYAVDNFLTPSECQFLITAASDVFQPAPVVGKGIGELSASRTSSTCYLAREDLPEYLRKVRLLTGKPIQHCELPQVGRYFPSQQYLQHFDAFDLADENGRRFASNGGQRVVTVLVYLNTLTPEQGGATHFPNLGLKVQPQQGMALVFFPSTVDGLLDKQALHAALPPVGEVTKYVSQVWIRQSEYKGDASKRLNPIMGIPNYEPPSMMDVLQLKAAASASSGGSVLA